jgi:hypothetical protein
MTAPEIANIVKSNPRGTLCVEIPDGSTSYMIVWDGVQVNVYWDDRDGDDPGWTIFRSADELEEFLDHTDDWKVIE